VFTPPPIAYVCVLYAYAYLYTYIHIYIYVCVYACVIIYIHKKGTGNGKKEGTKGEKLGRTRGGEMKVGRH
jgi:hypothetical protein